MIHGIGSFNQPVTRQFWLVFLVGLGVAWIGFQAWYYASGKGHQSQNLELAREQLPRAEAIVASDPRFRDVRAGVWTGINGSLGFFGRVETADDLNKLLRAVAKEHFRVPIFWAVKVTAEQPPE
jgi:hypothetical protein